MSQFQVTTSELNNAVNQLTEKNDAFKTKLNDFLTLQEELSGMWQGDASTAFAQAFQSDKAQWDNFTQVLDGYIQTLKAISAAYEQAEEMNKSIAMNRTY